MQNSPPIATVALPLWQSEQIAWLALESLCRQKKCDFAWELIVLEDEDDDKKIGQVTVDRYLDRLSAVGCTKVVYETMPGHPLLAEKWLRAANLASPSSEVFFIQGGDDFTHPHRVANAVAAFQADNELDWYQSPRGYFYDLCTNKTLLYDYDIIPNLPQPREGHIKNPIALEKSTRTTYVRQITRPPVGRIVDAWVFFGVQEVLGHTPKVKLDADPIAETSVFTSGLNSISLDRSDLNAKVIPPFCPTTQQAEAFLPSDCATRLSTSQIQSLSRRVELYQEHCSELKSKITQLKQRCKRLSAEQDRKRETITKLNTLLTVEKQRNDNPFLRFLKKFC